MTITSRTFFSCSLALPVVVGALGLAVPALEGVTFVMTFAVIPYLVCASILALPIRLVSTERRLLLLSLAAPWLMSLLLVLFLGAIDPPELRSAGRIVDLAGVAPISILVSYGYVGLAWLCFSAAKRVRLVGRPESVA